MTQCCPPPRTRPPQVVAARRGWEKGHFQYARYLDHTYVDARGRQLQGQEQAKAKGKAPDK